MDFDRVFAWIGIVTSVIFISKFVPKIIHACRVYFFPTYPDFSKYGKWSVVTGPTDGIGKQIALQLASFGQNVVLIARSKSKLEAVSEEIESIHKVQTKYLQIDFSHDEDIYDEIEEFLKGMDIGTLVNNVAIAHHPNFFLDMSNLSSLLRDITRVNMFALYKMHQIVLPGMVARKRGLIINFSSASASFPLIYSVIYGASKAFINYFSQALSYEYADKGITIQTCLPCLVSTNMTLNEKPSLFVRLPKDYASSLLATVDKERVTYGCWQHSLQVWIYNRIPIKWMHAVIQGIKERQDIAVSKHE